MIISLSGGSCLKIFHRLCCYHQIYHSGFFSLRTPDKMHSFAVDPVCVLSSSCTGMGSYIENRKIQQLNENNLHVHGMTNTRNEIEILETSAGK